MYVLSLVQPVSIQRTIVHRRTFLLIWVAYFYLKYMSAAILWLVPFHQQCSIKLWGSKLSTWVDFSVYIHRSNTTSHREKPGNRLRMCNEIWFFSSKGLELTFFSGVYGTCIGAVNKFGTEEKSLIGLSGIFIGIGEILGWFENVGFFALNQFVVVMLDAVSKYTSFSSLPLRFHFLAYFYSHGYVLVF